MRVFLILTSALGLYMLSQHMPRSAEPKALPEEQWIVYDPTTRLYRHDSCYYHKGRGYCPASAMARINHLHLSAVTLIGTDKESPETLIARQQIIREEQAHLGVNGTHPGWDQCGYNAAGCSAELSGRIIHFRSE